MRHVEESEKGRKRKTAYEYQNREIAITNIGNYAIVTIGFFALQCSAIIRLG